MIDRRQINLLLLGVLLTNFSVLPHIKTNSNFSNGLELGTQIYEVHNYDEVVWKNTINFTFNPCYWFGGEANVIGAKSKLTIEELGYTEFLTSVIFKTLLFSNQTLSLYQIVSNHGYNDTYIDDMFTRWYLAWTYKFHYWTFTTHEFDFHSTFETEHSKILQYPQNFTQILEDYSNYTSKINNDTAIQALNISFPLIKGDSIMWHFIINRFAIGKPINYYLTTLINVFDCKHITSQDNKLIFQNHGEEDYYVEVFYNPRGIIENFIFKNSEGYVFYKITSSYPQTVFYIILGIIIVFIFGITIMIIIVKKNKRKKRID